MDQTRTAGVLESNTAQTTREVVLESSGALLGNETHLGPMPEDVPDLGEIGTRLEPVPDLGEVGAGPAPVFFEALDDPLINLDRVGDVDEEDSPGSLIEIIQQTPIQIPTFSMEKPKRRFKTPARRTYLPIVRKLVALRFGTSSVSP